jgi:hypothetical protein
MSRAKQSDINDRLMQIRKQEQLNASRNNKLKMRASDNIKYKRDVDELLQLLQRIPVDQYYKSMPQSGSGLPAIAIPLITTLISTYGPKLLEKAYSKITGGGISRNKYDQIKYIAQFINKYPYSVNDLFRL